MTDLIHCDSVSDMDETLGTSQSRRSSVKLKPVREGSVRLRVRETIRDAIFSGKFQPGDTLTELHLARDLGVSQSTVREALLHLEHSGLVIRTPNKCAKVTRLTGDELRERISLRMLLETVAAIEASARMTRQDFADLEGKLKDVAKAVEKNDYYESATSDLEFHRFIWQCSGNKTLYQTLDHLTAPLFAFVSILRSSSLQKLEEKVLSHKPIITAIGTRDPNQIMSAISAHISTSYSQFLTSGMTNSQVLALTYGQPVDSRSAR